jgi:hypothetical protein
MRLALLALLLAAPVAHAAHPLVTEDTGTQGTGKFQLEVNAETTRDRTGGALVKAFQPAVTLSYGLLDNLDVQLGRPYLRQVTDTGGASNVVKGGLDTSLDFKWRLYEKDDLSIGLKPGIPFATGDERRGLGNGKATIGGLLIASLEREHFALHAHAGWRHNSNNVGLRERIVQVAAAAVYKATEETRLILDLSRTTNPDPTSSASIRYVTLGLIHSPLKNLDLDLGWRHAAGDPAIDRSFMFGATLRW